MATPAPFIRPVERRRAFEEILDQLEAGIAAGHLSAGDRLPAERELAAGFGVSRTSVREALRVLEALGLVTVRRGADHGVVLREEPENALVPLFRFHLALRHLRLESLIEFRVLAETWAAAAAAERGAIDEIGPLLATMEASPLDQVAFHELDAAFHISLARASGNELVALVLEGARTAIQRAMLQAILEVDDWPATRTRLVEEHRAIVEAIAAREPAAASNRMAEHIRRFYEEHLE